jgi:tol-pal system protein YbgF
LVELLITKGDAVMLVKKYMVVVLVCSSIMLSMSCSSVTMLRTKELKLIQSHIDSLQTQLVIRQVELLNEQKSQNELLRLIRADQQVRFDEMGQKITSLEGSLTESKYRLSQIDKKTQEIQEQWKAKTVAESTAVNQTNSQMEKLYQIAYSDFTAGRFDLAWNGFADFIKRFPDSPLCDEATYFSAECLSGKKEHDKAEAAFSDYLRRYRDGKKVCAALYKLGVIFENKKQFEKRKMVWQKLIKTCPTSDEASMAKDRLGK